MMQELKQEVPQPQEQPKEHKDKPLPMLRRMRRLWRDERGQSTTEYILMLFLVLLVANKFKGEFMSRISDLVGKLGGKLDTVTEDDY